MTCSHSSKWADFAVTGADTTAIVAASGTDGVNQYKQIYVTGLIVDTVGLGTGEYAKIGCGTATTAVLPATYNNTHIVVDYTSMGGVQGSRLAGPASTALNVIRTGSSTKVTGSVGYYISD